MDNNEILETVKDFLTETNQLEKLKKWSVKLGLEDDELFDLEEWAS